ASGTVIAVATDENYIISACNDNLTRTLHSPEKPLGRYLGNILCPLQDNERFSLLVSREHGGLTPQMLKVCYTEILYKCYTFRAEGGFIVLGDRMGGTENEVLETMSLLNNELSALTRELGKKNRELEKAHAKITELSRKDPLTGLANRRYFKERYEEEFSLARRHGFALSVAMMDLDHFKQVNDTLGHDAGDEVLKVFARVLRQNCRLEDLPCRFGGEEFIVFLPHTTEQRALLFGNRLREILSGVDVLEDRGYKITVSVGIAEQKSGDTPDGLIKRADDALYEAKAQGRDRCAVK
ncbi:MAG: GGDEF domain-containing protein, partial [Desulfosalsimonas sp.]